MNKLKTSCAVVAAAAGMLLVAGCNVGMAPSGGSAAEVEHNFKEMPPQEQIKVIQSSPAPAEKKAQLIKDIETKYGVKAGDAPVQPGTSTK